MQRRLTLAFSLALATNLHIGNLCARYVNAQSNIENGILKKQTDLERELRKKLMEIERKRREGEGVMEKVYGPSATLETTYDRFKDITTVSIIMPIHHRIGPPPTIPTGNLGEFLAGFDVIAAFSYLGKQKVEPNHVNLTFKTFSRDLMFGSDPNLIMLVDGGRLRLGRMKRSSNFNNRSVDEYVMTSIPIDVFRRIALAKRLRFNYMEATPRSGAEASVKW